MWTNARNPIDAAPVPLRDGSPECADLDLRHARHGRHRSERVTAGHQEAGEWRSLLDRVAAARSSA